MDIRANGKGYEEFVRRATEEYGANYIRGKVSRIYQNGDNLVVKGSDTLLGAQVEIEADLVVLATAMEARSDAKQVARMLNLSVDGDDFFSEAHPKLRPVECLTAGVYLAGACQYPKDIPDTVAQASGAAAKVAGLFANEYLMSEACIAEVNENVCAGCLACKQVCPFKAIDSVTVVDRRTKQERVVAKVNEGMCHGCGTCTATCRSGSVRLRGFTDDQILSQIEAFSW
jgi:heterodisulfide reductase subunit A